jgi:hypothetical protein
MLATDGVKSRHEREGAERLAVHGDRRALLETDDHVFRDIGCLRGLCGEHEHVRLGRRIRILEVAAFMAQVPQVRIARIDLLLRRGNGNAFRRCVVDRVFAAADIPLAPRRDDGQFGRERREGHLEAHLIVALPGASVRERVGADTVRNLHLTLGDERPRHGGAQQVLPIVDRAGAEGGENEIAHELFAQIFHEAFLGAGRQGFLAHAAQLFSTLSDVCRDANDARVVVLTQPRNDDRGVEAARIGQNDSAGHWRS